MLQLINNCYLGTQSELLASINLFGTVSFDTTSYMYNSGQYFPR